MPAATAVTFTQIKRASATTTRLVAGGAAAAEELGDASSTTIVRMSKEGMNDATAEDDALVVEGGAKDPKEKEPEIYESFISPYIRCFPFVGNYFADRYESSRARP